MLDKKYIRIVNKLLRESSRAEAIDILEKTDDKTRKEFLDKWKSKSLNICCLVLDFAKDKLVEDGISSYIEDGFGMKKYLE